MIDQTSAFARGSTHRLAGVQRRTRAEPMELYAAAGAPKKKVLKKKVAKKKAGAKDAKGQPEALTKAEFVAQVAERTGQTKTDADRSVNAVLEVITESVVDGKKISFNGFGTFVAKERAARKGRNPQTGEEIFISARMSPGFTASKKFKELCNEE
eukprot:CAMPEP_0198135052 /NCGR_PEP_ID=MMETSP1442-20131203/60392_1 /TAXON_ID= /ORGANISM="Craspedostauros australis, Strain CCMP3328" /LENGTH=154 /DNA_ID=CAMNT_0043796213 /DNA_START=574 /DNA_END=1038 /DNA_ORIENTATION=-